jgi:hypothetical protein
LDFGQEFRFRIWVWDQRLGFGLELGFKIWVYDFGLGCLVLLCIVLYCIVLFCCFLHLYYMVIHRPSPPRMNGKHDEQCNCVACLEYMEKEVEGNLDVWMPSERDVQDLFQVVFEKHIQLERVDLNEWGQHDRDVQEVFQVVGGSQTTDEIPSRASSALYPELAPFTTNHLADLGIDGEVEDVDLPGINETEQDENTIRVVYSVKDYVQAVKDNPNFPDKFHSRCFTSDGFVILEKYQLPQLDRTDFPYLNVDEDAPLVATNVFVLPPHVRNPATQVFQNTTAERTHNE